MPNEKSRDVSMIGAPRTQAPCEGVVTVVVEGPEYDLTLALNCFSPGPQHTIHSERPTLRSTSFSGGAA